MTRGQYALLLLYCKRLALSVTHRFAPAHRRVKKLCAVKGVDIQWVRFPPGDGSLQPVAIRATEEVTNSSKPLM